MANILIVDDVADNRQTLVRVLSVLGHSSETAANAADAVLMADSGQFDLVMMDIAMPLAAGQEPNIYGGLEATKQIRSRPHLRETPIIAVTAHGMDAQKRAILDSGCADILEKGSEDFLGRTRRIIEKYLLVATTKQSRPTSSETTTIDDTKHQLPSPSVSEQLPLETHQKYAAETQHSHSIGTILNQLIQELKSTGTTVEALQTAVTELGREQEYCDRVEQLLNSLQRALQRFSSKTDKPRPGESWGHWIINVIMGANTEFEVLLHTERDQFFNQLEQDFHAIQQSFARILNLANSQMSVIDEPAPSNSQGDISKLVKKESEETSGVCESPGKNSFVGTILVVDDEWEARRSLEMQIQQLNHRAFSCADAESAIEMLKNQNFDACLVDLHMPGMSGMEMIRTIREIPRLHHLPLIVVSGSGELNDAVEAIEIGANDYLQKPPHLPLLRARIEACLKQGLSRRQELGKFLPANVIDMILNDPEQLQQGKPADITVLFGDIRQFSRISDRIGAVETIRWISDVMNCLSLTILEHGGTLIDYVGDEILAMWGAPKESADHAAQACQCAVDMQVQIDKLNEEWQHRLGVPMQIGIGIHSGTAVVGNIGSKQRFKYGPLGPTVNVASRVQGATKYLRSLTLMTSSTAMRMPAEKRGRKLCDVHVQNIPTALELFELRRTEDSQIIDRDQKYETALFYFEQADYSRSIELLSALLAEHPHDGPTQLLLSRAIQGQFDSSMDNVWTLPGK